MGGWTASAVAASVTLFLVAGVCEVGGGWLVWQACREVREGTIHASGFSSLRESIKTARVVASDAVVSSSSRKTRGARQTRVSRVSLPPYCIPLPKTTQGKPWWWALIGSCVLILYGFVPCAQPIADFGRLYAAYGGFFVALSVAWAKVFDGFKPDAGDFIGCAIALVGVGVILFYPRPGGVEPGASAVFPRLANET
jgi:drug/metabolite transporter superfamily protein YnfA